MMCSFGKLDCSLVDIKRKISAGSTPIENLYSGRRLAQQLEFSMLLWIADATKDLAEITCQRDLVDFHQQYGDRNHLHTIPIFDRRFEEPIPPKFSTASFQTRLTSCFKNSSDSKDKLFVFNSLVTL